MNIPQMVSLVAGRQLQCDLTGRRSYDRMIGECEIMAGQSLSEIMIRQDIAVGGGMRLGQRSVPAGPVRSPQHDAGLDIGKSAS